jgi:hypothetical protein
MNKTKEERREITKNHIDTLLKSARKDSTATFSVYFGIALAMEDLAKAKKSMRDFFDNIKNNPCASCDTHCCRGELGFFKEGDLHQDLVEGNVDLMDYFVGSEEEDIKGQVCVFLKPGEGCNIPGRYRSVVCTSYACGSFTDRLYKNNIGNIRQSLSSHLYQLKSTLNEKREELTADKGEALAAVE